MKQILSVKDFLLENIEVLLAGSEYLDVFSMNRYAASPIKDIQIFEEHYDMPLLIGEIHFGAMDAGLVATGRKDPTEEKADYIPPVH